MCYPQCVSCPFTTTTKINKVEPCVCMCVLKKNTQRNKRNKEIKKQRKITSRQTNTLVEKQNKRKETKEKNTTN